MEWRINNGTWQQAPNTVPTQNIQSIQTWNELAWLNWGTHELPAGEHTLEVRFPKSTEEHRGKERTSRILAAVDAFCLTGDLNWQPHGHFKPGETPSGANDIAAAEKRFAITTTPGSDGRAWTVLNGLWQYAAYEDTVLPIDEASRLLPVTDYPKNLDDKYWLGYEAPGRLHQRLPSEAHSHRYLLRTMLDVPADAEGKGAFIDVQRGSMIFSVFVNGEYCGHSGKAFDTAWQLDISNAIKPGETNELLFIVKDAYYSLNPKTDKNAGKRGGNRSYWNLPLSF